MKRACYLVPTSKLSLGKTRNIPISLGIAFLRPRSGRDLSPDFRREECCEESWEGDVTGHCESARVDGNLSEISQ